MKVTVLELSQAAGIGKGTTYEYFKNKEDIVFEILNILIEEFNDELYTKLNKIDGIYKKLLVFFEFFYNNYEELKKIYKEFLAITLTIQNDEMKNFATKNKKIYYEILENILKEGVKKNELKKEAINYTKVLYNMAEGFFLENEVTYVNDNPQQEFQDELKLMYNLLKKDSK